MNLILIILFSLYRFFIPINTDIPDESIGVWQIPELEIAMPLYQQRNTTAQEVVDREYCALVEPFGIGTLIIDHAGSESIKDGKWNIGLVHPDTVAFWVTDEETTSYKCTAVYRATDMGVGYRYEGEYVHPKSATDILCCCCVDGSQDESYLAVFKRAGKIV